MHTRRSYPQIHGEIEEQLEKEVKEADLTAGSQVWAGTWTPLGIVTARNKTNLFSRRGRWMGVCVCVSRASMKKLLKNK